MEGQDRLPLFRTGLLGDLLYAGQAVIIDQLVVAGDDPAAEHRRGWVRWRRFRILTRAKRSIW